MTKMKHLQFILPYLFYFSHLCLLFSLLFFYCFLTASLPFPFWFSYSFLTVSLLFSYCFAGRIWSLSVPCLSTLWFQNRFHGVSLSFRLFGLICLHFQLSQPGQRAITSSCCQVWLHLKGLFLKYQFLDKRQWICVCAGAEGSKHLTPNFSGLFTPWNYLN